MYAPEDETALPVAASRPSSCVTQLVSPGHSPWTDVTLEVGLAVATATLPLVCRGMIPVLCAVCQAAEELEKSTAVAESKQYSRHSDGVPLNCGSNQGMHLGPEWCSQSVQSNSCPLRI